MKKLLFLLFIPFVTFSQSADGVDICLALQSNNFTTDAEAERALTRIMNASGLAKNFALIPCDNISNAVAVSYRGERYIIYDKKFMSLISSRTNDWSNLTILAHEVGHHLNGHSIDLSMAKIVEPKSLAEKRRQELEADEFAGFIMAKLGAPLSSVLSSMSLITTDDDDTYSTHPKRSRRLERLKVGYNKEKEGKSSIKSNTGTIKAIEKKVESKLGTVDGTWNLIDYTDDPFSEIKYSSFIEGENVSDIYEDKPILYFEKELKDGWKFKFPFIYISNIQSQIKKYLDFYNDTNWRTKIESYEKFFLKVYFTIAIDKDIISNHFFTIEESFKNEKYLFDVKKKSMIIFDEGELIYLTNKIKEGKQLYFKINKIGLSGQNKRSYNPNPREIESNEVENIIFKFNLKGSSNALRWIN